MNKYRIVLIASQAFTTSVSQEELVKHFQEDVYADGVEQQESTKAAKVRLEVQRPGYDTWELLVEKDIPTEDL
jgi:hypothetical protein